MALITISLCMIVKNEEQNLENCLESIQGIPDEIIIVDTGSTDRTKEIAKKWTSHVYDFEWINDFSAARNVSFSYATMEYILWLDADDILLPEDKQKFLQFKQSFPNPVDFVNMYYHIGFDQYNNVITTIQRTRLVYRKRGFQWRGVVHENLNIPQKANGIIKDIAIFHNRSLEESQTRLKTRRNIEIYEKFLQKGNTMSASDIYHYAQELKQHEMYDQAIKYYQEFLDFSEIDSTHRLSTYHQLTECYHHLNDSEKIIEYTLQSFKYAIPQPNFCCRLGDMFIKSNQYAQAIFWYDMALQIPVDTKYFDHKPSRTWYPHAQLAFCYCQLGQYEKSYLHNQQHLTYQPNNEDAKKNLELLKNHL